MVDPREDVGVLFCDGFAGLGVTETFGVAEPLALRLADGLGSGLAEAVPEVPAAFGWVVTSGVAAVGLPSPLWLGSNAMTRKVRTPAVATATVAPSTVLRLRLRCRAICLVVVMTCPFGIEPMVHWSVATHREKVAVWWMLITRILWLLL
ncbi:hypothetical protein [Streptomyces sp. NPDC093990]|uniref:hypothetical protein n=1 Tax=Streptomyces sp. NPDC093990 TaxID=3155306 RepID=UPI003426F9AC